MNRSTMAWIIVFLLILIIVLLSVCIYFDVQLIGVHTPVTTESTAVSDVETSPSQNVDSSTDPTVESTPLETSSTVVTDTQLPSTTVPSTSQEPPVTTTAPITTEAPVSSTKPVSPDAPTICIDPGHGFNDPGATVMHNGKSVYESNINMAISLKLKDALTALGYNVIMTHNGVDAPDQYLGDGSPTFGANERNEYIYDNRSKIDLVISIHCDSFSNTSTKGTRFYILSELDKGYNRQSIPYVESLITASYQAGILSYEANYYTRSLAVLRTGLPSVLVECGFITNSTDLNNLLDTAWQQKFANTLANGIDSYLTN